MSGQAPGLNAPARVWKGIMSKVYLYAATAALSAIILGTMGYVYLSQGGDNQFAQCQSGQAGADIGGPFTLVNGQGQSVSEKDVITKPTLVYFGYTFCPDVCPLDMSRNAEVADILEEQGLDLGLVFISVDPARDTPEIAAEYAEAHREGAIGLSGSAEQVAAAAKAYRVYYKAHPDQDPEYYPVDHSNFSYLMLPKQGFVDFYRGDASAESVAASASCMIEAAG